MAALSVAFAAYGPASAAQINTGGESGAYHKEFCPRLESELKKAQFSYTCTPSQGSTENITRGAASPKDIGFAQFDVFAHETAKLGDLSSLTVIRNDIGRECLFLVTKNKTFSTFGEVSALAPNLRFVLAPRGSGHTATFEYLQRIDAEGLGKAGKITYANSADDALEQVLNGPDDLVTLFVQFPDPDNARFKTINKKGGLFIPVIDRAILRQEIGGEKIYYAQETQISKARFTKKGGAVVTSCTPVTLFTGSSAAVLAKDPSAVAPDKIRADHEDLIKTIKAIPRDDLLPKKGFLSRIWKRTKELSAEGLEKAVALSEKAREKAAPYVQRAKEMGKKAMEKAKEEADGMLGKDKQTPQ